ncbi:hypothetical protein [Cryptosporangium japonicum]|uniref:Uncharacterized protein n=1 Tax=Cryptosporangium japonicum TaxID=80872 RepID=A0ABN0UE22_9ACTN
MIDPSTIRMDEFLFGWYGARNSRHFFMPAVGRWLPDPLKHWYEVSARLVEHRGGVKHVLLPEEIQAVDGKAIFLIDATGDWRWSFDVEKPSVVYDGECCEEWRQSEESLAQFLTHHSVQEAIYGARRLYRHPHVHKDLLPGVLAGLEQVDFPRWRWSAEGCRYFMGDRIVAEIVPDFGPPDYYQVNVASPERRRLVYLNRFDGIDWRKVG